MSPRKKPETVLQDEIANSVPHWTEAVSCQHPGCRNLQSIVAYHTEGMVIRPSGDSKKTRYTVGWCSEHNPEHQGFPQPKPYETVPEYFDRTLLWALQNDPAVRAATDEKDRSALLQYIKSNIARALSRGEL